MLGAMLALCRSPRPHAVALNHFLAWYLNIMGNQGALPEGTPQEVELY